MINGEIISKSKEEQLEDLIDVLKKSQDKLRVLKTNKNLNIYNFLNWSLKNAEILLVDIKNIYSIDNKIILSRKLFELFLSIEMTKKNLKNNVDVNKIIPNFVRSSGRRLDIKRICDELKINKEIYTFYSIFAHPYTYLKNNKEDDIINVKTYQILYDINTYEYQIGQLNQLLLMYMINTLITDINFIINRLLDANFKLDNFELNISFVYSKINEMLLKLNKKANKNK